MRSFILTLCLVLNFYHGMTAVIPDRLPKPCSKSVPNYSECTLDFLRKFQPNMVNGIREMNIPSFNPFHLPEFSVNRTLNDMVTISAVIKDLKVWGFDKIEFKNLKSDPETLTGEAEVYFPNAKLTMDYDATGKLLSPTPLKDNGHFKANISDINGKGSFSLKTTEKQGVKYFTLDKVQFKGDIGNAKVKMVSKNPENQGVADFISNFINENPQRIVKTTLAPLLYEAAETIARLITKQVLSTVPADELMPE